MKEIQEYKLGEIIPTKDVGVNEKLFKGNLKLVRIQYTLQDEVGSQIRFGIEDKDFEDNEQEDE